MTDPDISKSIPMLFVSPAATESIAGRVADLIRNSAPNAIVVDTSRVSVLIGHVVARELNARLVSIDADDGLLYFSTPITAADRVAFVGNTFPVYPTLPAYVRFIENQGGKVVAIASVEPWNATTDAAALPVPTQSLN